MQSDLATHFNPDTKIWSGPEEEYVMFPAIGQVLLESLLKEPNKVLQIFYETGEQLTCQDIYQQSVKIATVLKQMGLEKGDVVTIISKNHQYLTALFVAIFISGAIVNPLSPNDIKNKYDDNSLLKIAHPKFVFFQKFCEQAVKSHVANIDLNIRMILVDGATDSQYLCIENMLTTQITGDNIRTPTVDKPDQTVAVLLSTSGTTGIPKLVSLSHSTILSTIYRNGNLLKHNSESVMFTWSSYDWISGFERLIRSLLFRITKILTALPISPEVTVEIILKYNVAESTMNCFTLKQVNQFLKKRQITLPSLVYLIGGGDRLSEKLINSVKRYIINAKFVIIYAATEVIWIATCIVADNRISAGQILKGNKIKIMGENNTWMGPSQIGEVYVKSTYECMGYYNKPEATNAIKDKYDWVMTGDIGRFDETGFLYILGRKTDKFYSDGHAIYPFEIENILESHDDVIDSCVVGIGDDPLNCISVAMVERAINSTITEKEIIDYITDKIPKWYELNGGIFFITEFPKSRVGKTDRIATKKVATLLYNDKKISC